MIMVPFTPQHLEGFKLQDGQPEMLAYLEAPGYGELLQSVGNGYSLFDGETLLGCGGVMKQSETRALAWALVSKNVKPRHMVSITRVVKKELDASQFNRIEAIVRLGFNQAYRWALALGFRCETPNGMVNWFQSGEAAYLFARVR